MNRLNAWLLFVAALPAVAVEKPLVFGTVRFEENRGQADAGVRFLARARGQQVFLTDRGVLFSPPRGRAVSMQFAGASKCHWMPEGAPADSISYYLGNDPAKWVKMAPLFDRVVWSNAWPGVDIAFHGAGDRLEYDLVLSPRADPSQIRIRIDDPAALRVAADGTAEIVSEGNVIRQRAPEIWQETSGGGRHKVEGRFVADGRHGLRLAVSRYDRRKALVVDPVLDMATYVGGENDDEIVAVADGVVAGNTRSITFPGTSPALRSGRDIFVRAVTSPGSNSNPQNPFYGTVVFGGSGDDQVAGVAVTTYGNAGIYVAGTTTSTDFPIVSFPGVGYNGGASDGFVASLQVSRGFAYLGYTFYVGGSGEDRITSFAGLSGNGTLLAFAGVTDSPDLPTTSGVPQPSLSGGKDGFYGVVSATGVSTSILGYLGGSGDDAAYAVSLRNSSSLWIGGQTTSRDFPFATGSLSGPSDAFLAEVSTPKSFYYPNTPLTVKAWRIGGSGDDGIRSLVAASGTAGAVYANGAYLSAPFALDGVAFAGVTTSTDLPVIHAAQPQPSGATDGFVGIWDAAAAAPRWLTYLGGSGQDEVTSIAQTWSGDLYVGGWTASTDLPVFKALQPASAGGQDGLFAAYDYSGVLQHLTYFGGSGDDRIQGVTALFNLDARVVGSTTSNDLPQVQPSQNRGSGMDGFMADIGSDFFLGPANLILAKDGDLSFSIRPARAAFRVPVTYRSSDPARVRLVYLGRSFDQVTAAADDNIDIEGLADSGQADIIVTSPGFATKTVHVSLYPGAFVSSLISSTIVSTWATGLSLYATYCAIDPASGAAMGVCMGLRSGVPPPVIHWSTSDPTVLQIVDNSSYYPQLQALKAGTATITLSIDGYTVLGNSQTLTAMVPRPVAPVTDFHLGRDLTASLPIAFTLNNAFVNTGFQGTLTARSGDPSRLLLSLDANQPGSPQVSVAMSVRLPVIWAQALADDGPVQVYLSVSGGDGEVPIPVVLEPTVLLWGGTGYLPAVGAAFSPSIALATGQGALLLQGLQGISGGVGQLRPGAPPFTVTMSNSNPMAVELNRITLPIGDPASDPSLTYKALAVGVGLSNLTLASSNPRIQPVPATLPVSVKAPVPVLTTLPSTFYVGNGLQTPVTFRYDPGGTVNVAVDDASLALVSSSLGNRGTDRLALLASPNGYTFYVQGQRSSGTTTVRVQFPDQELTLTVHLLPSGAGFTSFNIPLLTTQPFSQEVQITAYALDPTTGIGVFQQTPQPGPGIPVHFSADAPVQLSKSSDVLTALASTISLDYSLPPAGQLANITVTTDGNSSVSPITAVLKVGSAVTPAPSAPATLDSIFLSRGELRQYSLNSSVTLPATVTSSDPQNVLVSTSLTDAGSPSVQLPKGAPTFYIHALGDSGIYTLGVDSPGAASSTIQVGLRPLQLSLSYYPSSPLLPGGTASIGVALSAVTLRPGVGPFHFTAQTTDPSVAKVTPAAFDIGGGATFAGNLTVAGVSPGTMQLIVTGPPDVYIVPPKVTVSVGSSAAPASQVLTAYTLGVNLQGSTQIDMGADFANPNGAIVTLTSTSPSVLLLSRSATTVGTASVVVAVAAGGHFTQTIYLQGVAQGSSTIQVTVNSATQAAATVAIAPSWVSCGTQPLSLNVGDTQSVNCSARYNTPPSAGFLPGLQEIGPRAGFTDLALNLTSSAPDVFTATPGSLTLGLNSTPVTLRGVGAGSGVLKLSPPTAFGTSPDGSESLMVSVTLPPLRVTCPAETVLGKDAQFTCTIFSATTITATSGDPSLLLVSADANTAGGATATLAPNANGVSLTIQALAAYGTVEVLVTAPGYRDLRIAVAMRPSAIDLAAIPQNPLRVGNTMEVTVTLRVGGYAFAPRAGANIGVDLTTDQTGVVSLSPAHVTLNGPQSSGSVQVTALKAGSTLLRMTAPAGYLVTGSPLAISVAP
jgi:hypothetical protein